MKERQSSVLIVAAAHEDRAVLRDALSRDPAASYVISEEESGLHALEVCRARKPDCLILDLDLPNLSGLDALKELTTEEEGATCAVVALVGAGDTRLAVEAMKRGAHECLEKGRASGAELRRAVSQAMEKAEKRRHPSEREHELIKKNLAPEADLTVLRREAAGREQGDKAWQVARAGAGASRPERAFYSQTEEQLRLLKTAIEQSDESVVITTAQLDRPGPQIVYINPAFTKMTGYTPEEMIGKTPRILQGPKTDRAVLARLHEDCKAGKVFHGEAVNYRKDGSEICLEWSVWPVYNERGAMTHFVAIQRDVTERRGIEDALRNNEAQLRAILDHSTAVIFVKDLEGRYLRVNRLYEALFGVTEAEVKGGTAHDIHAKEVADAFHANDMEVIAANRPLQFEEQAATAHGQRQFISLKFPLYDDSGLPYGVCGIATDITERKRAEVALRESNEKLQLALEAADVGTWRVDLKAGLSARDAALNRILGLPEDPLTIPVSKMFERIYPTDAPRVNESWERAIRTGIYDEEHRITRPDGNIIWVHDRGRFFYGPDGEPLYATGALADITKRKQVEDALKMSEERLNIAMHAGDIGMVDWDIRADSLVWSEKYLDIYGLPSGKTSGRYEDWRERVYPEDLPTVEALIWGTFERKLPNWRIEYRIVRANNGEVRWIESKHNVFYDAQGEALRTTGAALDITERKQAEETIRDSEARFRQLADVMPQIVYSCPPNGIVDYANRRWYEYTGSSTEQPIKDISIDALYPDDRERTLRQWRKSVETGQPFEIEYRFRRKDGQYRWQLSRGIPIRDRQGRVIKWIGTMTDIHDHKEAEAAREELLAREQSARETAEAASRSKDEFLALVSHELRSPLNAILGYAALLRHGGLDAQKIKHAADVIERSGKAQTQLIDDLLDTARVISGKLRLEVGPVNLVSVIQQAVQTIHPAANAKGISLETDLPYEIGQITGDPTRLQQVVWNLLSNAVKFTPQGGRVLVRLERIDPIICITVSDTGKGIATDFLPCVFDRFSQSDPSSARRYGGLGLGLALVKYLVELHGGTIEVASAGEGQGATFKVTLPLRAVAAPLGEAGVAPVPVKNSGELAGVRALVVDDEDNARELIETALTQYGADVVAVSSAEEAYTLITTTQPQGRLDVMVTDIGMPGEDGYSLIRRVREWERQRGAHIPAVALTAYGQIEDRVRALNAGFQMHVAKPVEPAELAAVITSLIRRPIAPRQ